MKTKFIIIISLVLLGGKGYSQQRSCGTNSSNSAYAGRTSNQLNENLTNLSFCVNVYFHVLRNDTGQTSIPAYYPGAILAKLNEDYAPYNISFTSLGTGYIDDTTYSNQGVGVYGGNVDALFATNNHNNAIDIYIAENSSWSGKANGILSKEFIVHKDVATTSVSSHEMGHCLDLYHTHHVENGVLELPDGSNCETAGDLVCDTPADPNLFSHWNDMINCEFPNHSIHVYGETYYPDTKNIMSYTLPECLQHFTDGQVERMKDAMYNEPILQEILSCCSTEPITISQSDEVCYSIPRTFYLENICYNTQTTWQWSPNLQVIEQDNFSIKVQAINPSVSGEGWVRATFNNSPQQLVQSFQVGVPSYYVQAGSIESQFVDVFRARWTRLFLLGVNEITGWEWDVDYSNVKPSETQRILIYPNVIGPIYAKVRRANQCGDGPWLIEHFEVIEQGGHKILID